MNLCAINHDEVCYEGKYCPACVLVEDVLRLTDEVEDLKKELEKANSNG